MAVVLAVVLVSLSACVMPKTSRKDLGYTPSHPTKKGDRVERKAVPDQCLDQALGTSCRSRGRPSFRSYAGQVGGGNKGEPVVRESVRGLGRSGRVLARRGGATGEGGLNDSAARGAVGRGRGDADFMQVWNRLRGGYAHWEDKRGAGPDENPDLALFLKDNPYLVPRAYTAGRGRKDWREKSPEYSDPDLPNLEYVDLPDDAAPEIEETPISANIALKYMEEAGINEPGNPNNYTEFDIQRYRDIKANELYWNDSWTLDGLTEQCKNLRRRIKKKWNLTSEQLVQIVDHRTLSPLLIQTLAPHLDNYTNEELEPLIKDINETLPR